MNKSITTTKSYNIISMFINGMQAYHVSTEILRQMYDNKHLVVLVSKQDTPNIPLFYIRYNDYISGIRLTNAGYCETQEPYNLSSFPTAQQYYSERAFEDAYLNNMNSSTEETEELK